MSIPADPLFGIPIGKSPITSIGAQVDRRRRSRRMKHAFALLAGSPAPGEPHVLFFPDHRRSDKYGDTHIHWDVYRTRAHIPEDAISIDPAEARPVTSAEIEKFHSRSRGDYQTSPEMVSVSIRNARGDWSTIGWWESPYILSHSQAAAAGTMHLRTEHLYCGIRQEPEADRWMYYTGLGGHLIGHGSAGSPEEAIVMARAYLYKAWLAEVERIREARCGDLSWGWPVYTPFDPADGDPPDPQRQKWDSLSMLTAAELAEKAGVTPSRIRQLADQIPGAVKRGKTWLFPADAQLSPPLVDRPKPGPKPAD